MILIVDTNVILSALMKESMTKRLVIELDIKLVTPEYALEEIEKYKPLILKKSGLNEKSFLLALGKLLSYIEIIPNKFLEPYKKEANKIIGHIDSKDVIFLATALYKDSCPIWSDDKHMKKQKRVIVYNTTDIINYLYVS